MASETGAPRVLVVEDNLFFSVQIETALKRMGYEVEVVSEGERALASATGRSPLLAIVNFGNPRLAPADLVRQLKALPEPPTVLGFCPHVQMAEIRPDALAAGCDQLVANSALTLRLPQIIEKLLANPTTTT